MLVDVKTLAILVMLAACTTTPDELDEFEPDAGVDAISVIYPCNVQHETCDAARDTAEVICNRAERCGEISGWTHLECVAETMRQLCGDAQCNSSPYDRTELDACLADLGADTTCGDVALCTL